MTKSDPNQQQGHFAPAHSQPKKQGAIGEIAPTKKHDGNWFKFYRDYVLSRPMLFAIVIGLLLEVQPYKPIQPTYFIAARISNMLAGTEDAEAHKSAVQAKVLADIEQSKECQKQREIAANSAHLQCVQSGKGAGYCRHVYDQAKQVHCPAMPNL